MSTLKSKHTTSARQPIERILVASDLTSYSDRALDRALMLANRFKAALRIVHVFDPTLLLPRDLAREKRHVKELLEREWRESPVASESVPTTIAASGDADRVIAETATAARADMIVVGHSDRASLTTALAGSTAERVMKHTNCAVLTVKRRPKRDYASIVVAMDAGASSQRALDMALSAFPNAQITVIHVDGTSNARSSRQELQELIDARCAAAKSVGSGRSTKPTVITKSGNTEDVLQKEITRLNPDLLVMGTHGRTGIPKIVFGSIAQWLLAVVSSDVLVVRG